MITSGSPDDEIPRLRKRLKADPRSTVFVALADAQRRTGKPLDALSTLRAGLRIHPDHSPARVVLARVHLDLNHRELAMSLLEEVVQADPNNGSGVGLLARLFVDAGRANDAAPLVERLEMAADPQAPALRTALSSPSLASLTRSDLFDTPELAERWEARGDLRGARRVWQRLLDRNPGHDGLMRRLSRVSALTRGDGATGGPPPLEESAVLPGRSELELLLEAETDALAPPAGRQRYGALARALWRTA